MLCPLQDPIRSTRLQSDRRERARMLRPSLLGMREYEARLTYIKWNRDWVK